MFEFIKKAFKSKKGKRKSRVVKGKAGLHPSATSTGTKKKKKRRDDEKINYDPEDDVWALEEGKVSVGRKYARSVVECFYPVIVVASLLGLFPIFPIRMSDGSYSIKFTWKSHAAILFALSFFSVLVTMVLLMVGIVSATSDHPSHPEKAGTSQHPDKTMEISRSEEVFVYKRNILTLIILYVYYMHLMVCMVATFHRKDFIAKQFLYWTEVVELLQLDVGRNVKKKLYINLGVLLAFTIVMVVMYFMRISPALSSCGATFYLIMWRVTDPQIMWNSTSLGTMKHVYALFLLYVIIASYLYIFWFYYNCRILTNILTIWNNRFQFCLHKQSLGGKKNRGVFNKGLRTSRAQLFQDHLVIFNLMEGINTQFEVIMESYYLGTFITVVCLWYGGVRVFFYYEFTNCGARQGDLFPLLSLLILELFLYIKVTLEAAGVADEARHVIDIVRRKGMMTSKLDNELWFMLSMRLSFGGHEDVGIIGAGFFYVTKAFLLGAISAITSHFIIFYQFEIPLSQTGVADPNFVHVKARQSEIFNIMEEGVEGVYC